MLPRDLNGKEIQKKRRDVCIRRADSLCCTVETNIIVKQLHSKKKKKNQVRERVCRVSDQLVHSSLIG